MENRKEDGALTFPCRLSLSKAVFFFLFSVFCGCALLGCAAPGEPTPPRPVVPQAVTDLAARQSGDAVVLTFTLPRHSVDGESLAEPPSVEIYRGWLPAGSATARLATPLIYTIPAGLVDTYVTEGRMQFTDRLRPGEHAGEQASYMVRTRASKRRASADSNVAAVRVYPVPEPVPDLRAVVAETAVELSWPPPARTTAGTPLGSLSGYRVYRAEVEPGAEAAAVAKPSQAKLQAPLALLAPTPSPAYHDTQFEFGHTYLYTVRSVAQYDADSAESADSQPVVVTPRDIFPPAAPKDLVAVVVPALANEPAYIELSWAISPETDLAGYYVYRSEQPDAAGERLTRELLPAPTFRDMSLVPGHRYYYRVTAVDRARNESSRSDAVSAELLPLRSP
jgi:hypothetical protein